MISGQMGLLGDNAELFLIQIGVIDCLRRANREAMAAEGAGFLFADADRSPFGRKNGGANLDAVPAANTFTWIDPNFSHRGSPSTFLDFLLHRLNNFQRFLLIA